MGEENKEKGIIFPKGENAEIWKTLNILNFSIENMLKGTMVNTKLIWIAATMSTIAAINSLSGVSVLYKAMVFMAIGAVSIILSKKYIK